MSIKTSEYIYDEKQAHSVSAFEGRLV